MKIECQTCGCVYKINVDQEEDDCDVTAELIECPMCFNGEEAICIDTVKNSKKTDSIPSPYPPRRTVLSKEADEIIKNNYKDMIDKDFQKEIKHEWCEIIDNHLSNVQDELETEKNHSNFLERLLKALYGSGWEYLTISKANEIRKSLGGPE